MSGRSSLEGSGDESRRAPNHLRKMFTEVCSAGQSSTKNLLFLAGFGGSPSATRRTTTVKTSPRGDSKGRKSSAVSRDLDATQKSPRTRAKSEPQQSLQSAFDELQSEIGPEKSAPAELGSPGRVGKSAPERGTGFQWSSEDHIDAPDDRPSRLIDQSSRVSFEEIRPSAVANVSAVCQSHACEWYERTRARAKAQPPRKSIDRAGSIARVYAAEADAAKIDEARKVNDRQSVSFRCRVLLLSSIRWFRAEPFRIAEACATATAAGLFGCVTLDEQRWEAASGDNNGELGEFQGKTDFSPWMAMTALFMVLKHARLLASFQEFGPLLLILKRICVDIARFFFLFGIVVLAFAAGLHLLYVESEDESVCEGHHSFKSYGSVLSMLIEFSVNMQSEFDCVSKLKHKEFGMAILVLFTVISALLLANMLIASMTKTFDDVYEAQEQNFAFNRARDMMGAEHLAPLPPPLNLLSLPYKVLHPLLRVVRVLMGIKAEEEDEDEGVGTSKTSPLTRSTWLSPGDTKRQSFDSVSRRGATEGSLAWLVEWRKKLTTEACKSFVNYFVEGHEIQMVESGRWRTRLAGRLERALRVQHSDMQGTLREQHDEVMKAMRSSDVDAVDEVPSMIRAESAPLLPRDPAGMSSPAFSPANQPFDFSGRGSLSAQSSPFTRSCTSRHMNHPLPSDASRLEDRLAKTEAKLDQLLALHAAGLASQHAGGAPATAAPAPTAVGLASQQAAGAPASAAPSPTGPRPSLTQPAAFAPHTESCRT